MKFIDVEQRELPALGNIELRAGIASGGEPHLVGHAAVFNSPTVIGGCFIEKLAPGCFANTIAQGDIRALANHNADLVLGRTASGTLTLSEDATGLYFDLIPPNTSAGRDTLESVRRGDLSGCSFSFQSTRELWDDSGDLPTRIILECDLFEISAAVTWPAYTSTSVGVRSIKTNGPFREIAPASVIAAMQRMKAGIVQREMNRVIN